MAIAATAAGLTLVYSAPAQAADNFRTHLAHTFMTGFMMGRHGMKGSGVFGTVTAVNGSTLTVTVTNRVRPYNNNSASPSPIPTPTTVTYTITTDSNTKVTKNGSTAAVSDIAVNDTIVVQGTVNGTNVTATAIIDGKKPAPTPIITGNGQPVVAGSITAINGASLTVTNSSNVIYTVDDTNAKVEKANVLSSTSNLAVGDKVVIQGTFNGTTVTASSIIDSGNITSSNNNGNHGFFGGMMNGIRNFFGKIFGF